MYDNTMHDYNTIYCKEYFQTNNSGIIQGNQTKDYDDHFKKI